MADQELATMDCVPCRGGVPPVTGSELETLKKRLGGDWEVINEHHLLKEFRFPDYKTTLTFVNAIAEIAEQQGHHPNISFTYGRAEVTIWTHKIQGLTESDFVLAAKVQKAYDSLSVETEASK